MMSVDDTLMCSFQILKPAEKKGQRYQFTGSPAPSASGAGAMGGAAGSTAGAIYAPTANGGGAGGTRPLTPPKGGPAPAAAGKGKGLK